MTVVLVHGNPETDAVWDPLVDALGRDDVVRFSPPGFGAPLPDGFPATYIAYRDWLEDELEGIDEPVDLVGHDWGGGHVVNVVMHRPELVRSWASDIVGVFDPDYVWHDLAQVWQTPGEGEQLVETMMGAHARGPRRTTGRRWVDTAGCDDDGRRPGSGDGSGDPVVLPLGAPTRHGRGWPGAGEGRARPGLSLLATEDHYIGSDEIRRRAADRAGARTEVLDGLGHWWMVQDPARGAAALTRFWEIARLSSEPYPVHRVHGGTGQTAFGAGGPETVLPVAVPQFTEPLHWSSGRAALPTAQVGDCDAGDKGRVQ